MVEFNYQYDSNGRIRQWTQQQGGASALRNYTFAYDRNSQLTEATVKDASDNIIKNWSWQYDPAGNRIAEEKDASGLIPSRHNGLNQLTEHGSGPIRFAGSIDEPGKVWVAGHEARMRNMTDFEAWLELSPGTHPIDITAEDYSDNSITQTFQVSIADEGQVFLTYDLNGNLLARVTDNGTVNYEWDAVNRLVAIEVEGGTRSEFLYDGLSRRVGITEKVWDEATSSFIPHTSSFYLWDGLTIAEQRSGVSGETVEKRFFPEGVEIVTGPESGTYTYRTDHLGSIREVVDSPGNLTSRFDYSPWGEIETVSGSFDLDFGFTGHFIHQPTGLYLAPFRAYVAGLGRWLSRDPLEEFGNDGFNLYAYVRNNPINRIDPFGLEGLTVPIGEFEGAGDALERIGRQIEAGDRMGGELANRHQRPGLIRRGLDFCKHNSRSLKAWIKSAGFSARPKPPNPLDRLLSEDGAEAMGGVIELERRGLRERNQLLANPDCPAAWNDYNQRTGGSR